LPAATGGCVAGDGVLEDRHLGIEHRDVHVHAAAAALPLQQGCLDADHREESGRDVAERRAHTRGRPVRLPGHAHDAAHALHDDVVGGPVRVGARLAKARGRSHHEARVARVQRLPAVAEALHGAGTKVLDENVGAAQQALEDGAVPGVLQVERDALLAAIQRRKVGGAPIDEGPDLARVVTTAGRLDLDDARTQIRQHQGAEGAREDARQIDDQDAGERAGRVHSRRTITPISPPTRSTALVSSVSPKPGPRRAGSAM